MLFAAEGNAICKVCKDDMRTNPRTNNMFTRPVVGQSPSNSTVEGEATILVAYADASGSFLKGSEDQPSVSAVQWIGNDGPEELHIFYSFAWFDMGSWAWANFFAEWATRGAFQGERRYYLGPVVDDLFLGTAQWVYDGDHNEGVEERMSGEDMETFAAFQDSLNAKYGSNVITEFAFNGNGVLEKVMQHCHSLH
ncbi:unnamed protein product [Choristocarpus tenellus]